MPTLRVSNYLVREIERNLLAPGPNIYLSKNETSYVHSDLMRNDDIRGFIEGNSIVICTWCGAIHLKWWENNPTKGARVALE